MNGFEDISVDGWQVRGTLSSWVIDLFDQNVSKGLRMREKGKMTYFLRSLVSRMEWNRDKFSFSDVWGNKKSESFNLSSIISSQPLNLTPLTSTNLFPTIIWHWSTKIHKISNRFVSSWNLQRQNRVNLISISSFSYLKAHSAKISGSHLICSQNSC